MTVDYALQWVDDAETLAAAAAALADADIIAVDTEFFRETSFFPVPALIQLTAGETVYLVDPQAVEADEGMRRLLSGGPLKLIHACSEDLEVLAMWSGVELAPMVDTQIAESLLGTDTAIGYRRLVQARCGVDIPKEETRSNWLERPLSPAQLDYAALDVVFLLPIWEQQRAALVARSRLDWLAEECATISGAREAAVPERWYLRHRQLWRLTPRQIEAYRQLAAWREREVRRRDTPRGWLAKDGVLFAVAEAMPKNRYELAAVEGVTPSLVKREGDALLERVKAAHQCEESELPPAVPMPTTPAFKRRMKALKQVVNDEAQTLELAPERLANRAEMEALTSANLATDALPLPGGWRGERLAERWRAALAEVEADA
ncbi:ribonuclease D [Salinicola aestuarinus]|uniref:ribonuclease D n=1 Tax=Salinicola aestuarinus TaxID=1949082 RepID=UPI000DA157F0|nr:HRDC domain-containing protein [Salinicola aestuarinus]